MSNENIAPAELLRTFAVTNDEIEFAHLCTAALNMEGWAIERVNAAVARIEEDLKEAKTEGWIEIYGVSPEWAVKLHVIRTTDTTRPDGAVARSFQP